MLSPLAKGGGYRNTNRFDHATTLRTVQEIFGVRPFLFAAANAPGLGDLFKPSLRLTSWQASGGTFGFTWSGAPAGKTNWIEWSSNLVDWLDLATNPPVNFMDTTAGDASQRFYRVRESR